MLDNMANLLLTVSLLAGVFAFPTSFALRYMIPGTAVGVLVGDLLFFWMAFRLAHRIGRPDVTAMPLGLDTPSTFGMVFFVLGPAFLQAKQALPVEDAARFAWHVGICSIFVSGLFKLACAWGSNWIRRLLPRAGLLGSLTAIALVLISFLPLLEILTFPLIGWLCLAIILTTLVAHVRLPLRIPGALGGLLVGAAMYYGMLWLSRVSHLTWLGPLATTNVGLPYPAEGLLPYEWLTVFRFEWCQALGISVQYLPIVLPFALATVIGGIDCTESAAAAGDEFHTGHVIAVEACATIVASLCGGVIQSTPYIGHPAYKAMGGRAAYTLATALFIGSAGLIGYFGYLYAAIPMVTVFPILMFVGLEITSQSFQATPQRHYPAVALACVPALATLVLLYVDKLFGDGALRAHGLQIGSLQDGTLRHELQTIRMLGNGFVMTSLLWASALATLIDGRLRRAAVYFGVAALAAAFGVIHSPQPGNPVFLPWRLNAELLPATLQYVSGYAAVAILLTLWGGWRAGQTGSDGPN
jgi:AGZA family xanthine/uracil permease-like MFS transporter